MINWDISPIIHARGKKLMSEPVFVRIDGAIEESMVRTFREQMDYAANTGQPVIPVIINSPGGDVWTMNAMIGIIDSIRRRAHVATIVEGKACSAGAWIFAAGDTRFVGLRSVVMLHEDYAVMAGKASDLKHEVKEIVRGDEEAMLWMDERCKKRRGYFRSLFLKQANADMWLTPKDCIKHGLAHYVGSPEFAITVSVEYQFGVPEVPKAKRKKGSK